MNQHTKGPWRATLFQGYDKVGIVTADDGRSICSLHWGGMTTEEVNANAILIAVAPKLLAVLRDLLAHGQAHYAVFALDPSFSSKAWERRARAAIAEAEGGA